MAGILNWDLGDASNNVLSNAFSHIYASSGNKTIKVYKGTAVGVGNITAIDMNQDDLVGTLDLSTLINLGGVFNVATNPALTKIINPVSSQLFSTYYAYDCSLNGILDVSGLTGLGGSFTVTGNRNLTKILCPTSSQIFTSFHLYNNNLTGILDVSGLTELGGNVRLYYNPNLTKILNPTSSQLFSEYAAWNCDLTGTLDVSGLTGLGGDFYVNNNLNLNYILNPSTNQTFTNYDAHVCGLMGTLDMRNIHNLGGAFSAYQNPSLNTILHINSSINFSNYSVNNCNLSILDISCLTGIGGLFRCDTNRNLTTIKMPIPKVGAPLLYYFNATDCSLNGTLDMSKTTNLGYSSSGTGIFWVPNNGNLTQIKNPATSNYIVSYDAANCNLTGTLDVSGFTNLIRYFHVSGNRNLTKIINPSSGDFYGQYLAYDCSLAGTLDLSGLAGIGSQLRVENNTGLTELTLPTIIEKFTYFNAKNCSLNLASVDAIYSKLRILYDSSLPIDNLIIYTNGGGNSWPTDGSSNANILQLYNIFDNSTAYDVSININYPSAPGETPLLSFTTIAYANNFDPSALVSSGTLNWDLGDTSASVDGNSVVHKYGSAGTKTVKLYKGTTTGATAITGIDFTDDNLTGTLDISSLVNMNYLKLNTNTLASVINPSSDTVFTKYEIDSAGLTNTLDVSGLKGLGGNIIIKNMSVLKNILFSNSSTAITNFDVGSNGLIGTLDISGLTGLGGAFSAGNNTKLNYIINPVSSQAFTSYYVQNTGLMGTLDISGLTGMAGQIGIYMNPSLNYILNPSSNGVINGYMAWDCSLKGTLDLSPLKNLGGTLVLSRNRELTQILFPASSQSIQLNLDACNLTGTLDVSVLSNLRGSIQIQNNPNLQNILFQPITAVFYNFWAYDCSLTSTCVDDILGKFDTWYTVNSPAYDISILLYGGGTGKPTIDGSTHFASIKAKFASTGKVADIRVN